MDEVTEQFNRILKDKNDAIDELKMQIQDKDNVKRAQQRQGPVTRESDWSFI